MSVGDSAYYVVIFWLLLGIGFGQLCVTHARFQKQERTEVMLVTPSNNRHEFGVLKHTVQLV